LGAVEEYERFPRPADSEGITRERIPKLWCNRLAWQLAPEGSSMCSTGDRRWRESVESGRMARWGRLSLWTARPARVARPRG